MEGEKRPHNSNGTYKTLRMYKGAVFIYVLFSVALFMLLFSTLIFSMNRNVDYMTKAVTVNKLYNDSVSAIQKVIGLFQGNPTNDEVYAQTQKRDVTVQAFSRFVEGYVYDKKSDVIKIDSSRYNPRFEIVPSTVTITNLTDSKGPLIVLSRKIKLENNFIEKTQLLTVPVNSNSNVDLELFDNNKLVYKQEFILSSKEGALYKIESDLGKPEDEKGKIPLKDITVSTIAYEQPKAFGTGEKVNLSLSAPLDLPSIDLVSKQDFSLESVPVGQEPVFSSSINRPGISSSYEDTFELNFNLNGNNDWVISPNDNFNKYTTTFGEGRAIINYPSSYTSTVYLYLNNDSNRELDLRGTLDLTSMNTNGEIGIVLKLKGAGSNIFFAGVKNYQNITYYSEREVEGVLECVPDTPPSVGNLLITHIGPTTAPTKFHDNSTTCRADTNLNDAQVFRPVTTNKIMLRFVRKGDKIDTYFCDSEDKCDKLNYPWPLMKDDVYDVLSTNSFYPGFYARGNPGAAFSYYRVSKISGEGSTLVFNKTINFGRTVTIKRIEADGFIPSIKDAEGDPLPNFLIKVGGVCQPIPDENPGICSIQSSMVFKPVADNNGGEIERSDLPINIELRSLSGELSEIPFIRSIRIYYTPKL